MTKVTISRELLERIDESAICDGTDATISNDLFTQLVAALAAPRQPEGEAISRERVQAEADAFFDWPTTDTSSVTTTSCLIFARCIAGMVAAERDATIAERDATIERLEAIIQRDHWKQMAARKNMLVIVDVDPDNRSTTEYIVTEDDVRALWSRIASLVEQRDKLTGLLDEVIDVVTYLDAELIKRIDAALAEVNK